jgi:chromosome segregation ATPase
LTAVRGEAGRWRTCANQLTERANRANPEEQKRLLRENLQRQLASEREELRKTKLIVSERDADLNRLRTELAQLQSQHKAIQDEIARTTQNLAQKEQAYCDLVNKEMQVESYSPPSSPTHIISLFLSNLFLTLL